MKNEDTIFVARTFTMSLRAVNVLESLSEKTRLTKSDLVRKALDLLANMYETDPSILENGGSNDGRPRSDQVSSAAGDDPGRDG